MEITITLNERQHRLLMEMLHRTPLRGNEAGNFVALLHTLTAARPAPKASPAIHDQP